MSRPRWGLHGSAGANLVPVGTARRRLAGEDVAVFPERFPICHIMEKSQKSLVGSRELPPSPRDQVWALESLAVSGLRAAAIVRGVTEATHRGGSPLGSLQRVGSGAVCSPDGWAAACVYSAWPGLSAHFINRQFTRVKFCVQTASPTGLSQLGQWCGG